MATFNIQIVTDAANSRRVIKNVTKDMERLEKRSDSLRNTLKNVFAAVSAGLIVRQLVTITDTYTNLQNRIRTVTDSQEELIVVTKELGRIANETRSSFAGTAEVYARTALATRELGISQRQTLEFAQSLNQAVLLSGASAQEAENALIQLSQGLASGALRGDELRSVLEQLPVVADVIAKQLNVTRGELRELGADGAITADIILGAFANAREELSTRFAKSVPTIAQAFTVLKNTVIQYVGTADQANGISRKLAETILFLSKNIDVLVRSLVIVSAALTVGFAQKAVGAAITAVRTLSAVILTNPIGAIATAVVAAIGGLVAFSDQIKVTEDNVVSLRDVAGATFDVLKERIGPVVSAVSEQLVGAFNQLNNIINDLGFTFDDILQVSVSFINKQIGLYVGLANAAQVAFDAVKKAFLSIVDAPVVQGFIDTFKGIVDFIYRSTQQVIQTIGDALSIVGIQIIEFGRLIDETFDLPEITIPKSVITLGQDIQSAFLEGFEADYIAKVKSILTPVYDEITRRSRETAEARIADENRVEEATKKAFDSLDTAAKRVSVTLSSMQEVLKKYSDSISDLSEQTGNVIVNAFDSAADAVAEFAVSGKFDFKSFADSVIKDIVRIATQQALILPLLSAAGGGFSNLFTAAQGQSGILSSAQSGGVIAGTQLQGFADGGSVRSKTPIIVGEEGPEVFVPSSAGTIIPNNQSFSNVSAKTGPDVVVNVNNQTNANATVDRQTGADGTEFITVTVAQDFFNNGPMFQALQASTGVTRRGR